MRRSRVLSVLILIVFVLSFLSGCGREQADPDPEPELVPESEIVIPAGPVFPEDVPGLSGDSREFGMSVDGSVWSKPVSCVVWGDRIYIPARVACDAVGEGFISIVDDKIYIRRMPVDSECFGVLASDNFDLDSDDEPDPLSGLYVVVDGLAGYVSLTVSVSLGIPDAPDEPVIEFLTAMPERIMYGRDVYLITEYTMPAETLDLEAVEMTYDGRGILIDPEYDDRIWIETDDGLVRIYAKSYIYGG